MTKEQIIKDNTPPTNDWEHYADRLYDIAYKSGYDEAIRMIDDIKTKIEEYKENEESHLIDYRYYRNETLDLVLDIIDSYIKRSE